MAVRNRMSKVAVVGVGLMLLAVAAVVALRTGTEQPTATAANPRTDAGQTAKAASDIPVETLTALSGTLEGLSSRMESVQGQFEEERRTRARDEAVYMDRMLSELKARDLEITQLKETLEARTGGLMQEMASLFGDLEGRIGADYPVQPEPARGELRPDGRVWFSGAGSSTGSAGPAVLSGPLGQLGALPEDPFGISPVNGENAARIAVYTLPREATLVHSRSLTALIGRVPVGGQVSEPLPFKVITGADNLMANGQELPGIAGTVWSGVAIGDAALECVTGRLTSVTFIFRDGAISTFPENPSDGAAIGWISDERGYPCIPGKHVSNTREVLQKMFGAGFASGATGAFAQAQTTTTGSAASGLSQAVTGDAAKFALGRGAAAGFGEWARIVAERARDVFDAVVVQPGQTVTVHTSVQIPIDYDHNGRSLRHAAIAASHGGRPGGLD